MRIGQIGQINADLILKKLIRIIRRIRQIRVSNFFETQEKSNTA